MKKINSILSCIATVFFLIISPVNASASDFCEVNVSPKYTYMLDNSGYFSINNYVATIELSYTGYPDMIKEVHITTKLKKQVFLFFWSDVTTWENTSYNNSDTITYTYGVSSGTYRIEVTYDVTGIDGNVESVSESYDASC